MGAHARRPERRATVAAVELTLKHTTQSASRSRTGQDRQDADRLRMRFILVYHVGMNSKPSTVRPHEGAAATEPGACPTVAKSARAADGVRRLTSDEVFAGAVEVLIRHGGVDYRLRRTGLGKLILTK